MAGDHPFDAAVHTANGWLRDIDAHLAVENRQAAYEALRAVLHVLRDRLTLDAVLGLSAQVPLLIRGVLLEGWRPQDGPSHLRHPVEFADAVSRRLPPSYPATGLEATQGVFAVLAGRLDPGEVRKIAQHLPQALRPLLAAPDADIT